MEHTFMGNDQPPMYPMFNETEWTIKNTYTIAISEKKYGKSTVIDKATILGMLMMANKLKAIPEFRIRYWAKQLDNL